MQVAEGTNQELEPSTAQSMTRARGAEGTSTAEAADLRVRPGGDVVRERCVSVNCVLLAVVGSAFGV